MHDSEAARQFVGSLIDQKFPQGLEIEVREQLIQDLLTRLEAKVNRAVVDSLSSEQLVKLEHLIDAGQVDKVQDFLYKEGVNVQALVARVMTEFHASYIGA